MNKSKKSTKQAGSNMRITASLRDVAAVAVLVAGLAAGAQAKSRLPSSCPDYAGYSQKRHEPYSSGRLKLPFMRPSEECRTFKSPAVEVRRALPSCHQSNVPVESHPGYEVANQGSGLGETFRKHLSLHSGHDCQLF